MLISLLRVAPISYDKSHLCITMDCFTMYLSSIFYLFHIPVLLKRALKKKENSTYL